MIIELESKDVEKIADKVIERLTPYLKNKVKDDGDVIFDIDDLAKYLKVKKQWLYERTHLNEIPFYKIGRFPRFKKKQIDKWIEDQKQPYSPLYRVK